MKPVNITIGTRGSDLALYQAHFIKKILEEQFGCCVDIKIIKTSGDKIDDLAFDKMEGKGFFTKEIEDSLLNGEVDLAVHSLKDLMTTQPEGLKLGAAGYRADRREMLLIRKGSNAGEGVVPVRPGGIIGTSSARRKCQIAFYNDSLEIRELRGNVPTRIRKLREGMYDAIVIAAAGVKRLELDLSDLKAIELDPEDFLPAPAQGILGLQIRHDDPKTEAVVSKMGSPDALIEASLERGLLAKFNSGCSLPLGVYSEIRGEQLRLKAVLGIPKDDGWDGMVGVDLTGNNVNELVEKAFMALCKEQK
ncbi:MAG: hydroxymethylbilane synthase [candidate division Zixibacteria bacterium HGW-Zixibacteria-1]|nr:MAG: hydroxymethylbilane synthase [candidate division Zixibacteria bacterium HGW-Zixibacteria-1]